MIVSLKLSKIFLYALIFPLKVDLMPHAHVFYAYYLNTKATSTHIYLLINWLVFHIDVKNNISSNMLKDVLFCSTNLCSNWIYFFEDFNIFENNLISIKIAMVS